MRNYSSGFQTLRRDPELSREQLLISPTVEKHTERISIRTKITCPYEDINKRIIFYHSPSPSSVFFSSKFLASLHIYVIIVLNILYRN